MAEEEEDPIMEEGAIIIANKRATTTITVVAMVTEEEAIEAITQVDTTILPNDDILRTGPIIPNIESIIIKGKELDVGLQIQMPLRITGHQHQRRTPGADYIVWPRRRCR